MRISGLRFLAVEDHEFQRGLLLKMLAGLGAEDVRAAADGRAALMIVRLQAPPVDIIISDLDMPGMDGLEFMRHLGEAGFPVSIILASALESPLLASVETMARGYGVRVLGVIPKPVTPEKLMALIGLHAQGPGSAPAVRAAGPSFALEEILEGLKNDEFEPFFQPKVDLATGRVVGAEALARWSHPRQGILTPAAFIGPLEAGGEIDVLTRIMVRRAAGFCRLWHASGVPDATVSVNLSLQSIPAEQFAERLTQLARGEGLDPRHMTFEITESAAGSQAGHALENLSRLRMKGFGLSIDHYGTGRSSMQELTRVAFTELKIDRSFVANAATQPAARVVLGSSLEMAKSLKISSVGTGVETQQDWFLLRQLGCDVAQGYFIARPLPAAGFFKWMRERETVADVPPVRP